MSEVRDSFVVPDLSPLDRPALRRIQPRFLFVAESPHISEIEPLKLHDRRPLCGAAGKVWWNALAQVIEKKGMEDLSVESLTDFCARNRIAVLNAVQIPMDPKVMRLFPDADPIKTLGFSKEPGASHYKKLKESAAMERAIRNLRTRLNDPSVEAVPVICLGNDSLWFVERALAKNSARILPKIAHPSAWWRKGGSFGRAAHEILARLFTA